MFDNRLRRLIDPVLVRTGAFLANKGVGANMVTVTGFLLGVAAAALIVHHLYLTALIFILLSRLADGLDGSVARAAGKKSDLGGYLDIVLDFVFYGLVPLAFVLSDPEANAVAGAVLLFSFYANGSSFLAFGLMAEKRGTTEHDRGSKSLVYTAGLAEATETIGVFVAFCLFPAWFSVIAFAFSAVCGLTTIARILLAIRTF